MDIPECLDCHNSIPGLEHVLNPCPPDYVYLTFEYILREFCHPVIIEGMINQCAGDKKDQGCNIR